MQASNYRKYFNCRFKIALGRRQKREKKLSQNFLRFLIYSWCFFSLTHEQLRRRKKQRYATYHLLLIHYSSVSGKRNLVSSSRVRSIENFFLFFFFGEELKLILDVERVLEGATQLKISIQSDDFIG